MRVPLNCWIVAIWFWVVSRFRGYCWSRRSLHFKGLVPHAGVGFIGGYREVFIVEYVPPKARIWTMDNLLVLFFGRYRVWRLRAVSSTRFRTMEDTRNYLKENGVDI
jgi:hypothetical protein